LSKGQKAHHCVEFIMLVKSVSGCISSEAVLASKVFVPEIPVQDSFMLAATAAVLALQQILATAEEKFQIDSYVDEEDSDWVVVLAAPLGEVQVGQYYRGGRQTFTDNQICTGWSKANIYSIKPMHEAGLALLEFAFGAATEFRGVPYVVPVTLCSCFV
jgi:hypothetical protein